MSSYIGNEPASSYAGYIAIEQFSGNGVQTVFVLGTNPVTITSTDIFIGGIYQQKSTYSLSGNTVTFSSAPTAGTNNIEVKVSETLPLSSGVNMFINGFNAVDDAAAAIGGVPIGGLYRNGSAVMVRVV